MGQRATVALASGCLLSWGLWAMVSAPISGTLGASTPLHANSRSRGLSELGTMASSEQLRPTGPGSSLQQAAADEQEGFCRGLASLKLPPPLLDIPWLPAASIKARAAEAAGWGLLGEPSFPSHGVLQRDQGDGGGGAGLEARQPYQQSMARSEEATHTLAMGRASGPGPLARLGRAEDRADWWDGGMGVGGMGGEEDSSARLRLVRGMQSRLPAGEESEPYQMYVYANGDVVSGMITQEGSWEAGETGLLLGRLAAFAKAQRLPRESVFLMDIGANIGVHTVAAAAHGFSVLAFEPMHVNTMSLRHTLCANPSLRHRVSLVPKGLGNATEACTIYSSPQNVGDGAVLCGAADSQAGYPGLRARGKLQVARLDDLMQPTSLQSYAGRVGVVKIDVEGSELLVLEGGLRFFEEVRPPFVMAECSDGMMTQATGKPASAFLMKMSGLGYTVSLHSFDGLPLALELLSKWKEPGITNYWFSLRQP